jgi:hypothetical protein
LGGDIRRIRAVGDIGADRQIGFSRRLTNAGCDRSELIMGSF